ncbi:RNA binding domain-containing protein [Capsaspora owczarzaki ATCC 30864]|uniref:RNA binding domain-containing protein n=1 Tax=Capsaspora owczarzaki (strain ATCC 30864) TaxID=595528 RepID=A0A0D2UAY7_CAPO3|nr:RNA binding domain-containing protein [Capsaspora owczarzaki ATCC 30864]KJE92201.1 RNA binding domain-containing protein [Capsaspora owczarzaki ATCC 30864]|eukprot:XP_004364053.1 RNA binding domain-containing protein [Capsaspora owczarzaki ATCC 30864]
MASRRSLFGNDDGGGSDGIRRSPRFSNGSDESGPRGGRGGFSSGGRGGGGRGGFSARGGGFSSGRGGYGSRSDSYDRGHDGDRGSSVGRGRGRGGNGSGFGGRGRGGAAPRGASSSGRWDGQGQQPPPPPPPQQQQQHSMAGRSHHQRSSHSGNHGSGGSGAGDHDDGDDDGHASGSNASASSASPSSNSNSNSNNNNYSRLIIKNLPKHLTEARLREHFGRMPLSRVSASHSHSGSAGGAGGAGEDDLLSGRSHQDNDDSTNSWLTGGSGTGNGNGNGNGGTVLEAITDVKLAKTEDGLFRRFGFIGFKTPQAAQAAEAYFHRTFIDTSRIEVYPAKAIGDADIPRPWSRYSAGSSAFERRQQEHQVILADRKTEDEKARKLQEAKAKASKEAANTSSLLQQLYNVDDDPELNEFLGVVAPRSQAKTWANDDTSAPTSAASKKASSKAKAKAKQAQGEDAAAAADQKTRVAKSTIAAVQAKRPGGEGVLYTKTHLVFGDDQSDDENGNDDDDDDYQDLPAASKAKSGPSSEAMVQDDDGDDEQAEDDDENVEQRPKQQQQSKPTTTTTTTPTAPTATATQPAADKRASKYPVVSAAEGSVSIAESGRLFVRNLPYTCTEDDLIALFSKFGQLAEVHMPIDKETKKPTGFAFVLFLMPEHAVTAFRALDGSTFQGRLLHLLPAKANASEDEDADMSASKPREGEDASDYRKRKQQRLKSTISADFNWNTLFIGNNTVADAISSKYGISKSDLLDPEAASLPVRMALAETQILSETKTFLEEQGIHLDGKVNGVDAAGEGNRGVLTSAQKKLEQERSRTVILVKNIPFSATEDELRPLFAKHGELKRFALPSTRALAVVEFAQPSEARSAFRNLAYSKFKQVPIYLEWAPVSTVLSAPTKAAAQTTTDSTAPMQVEAAPSAKAALKAAAKAKADAAAAAAAARVVSHTSSGPGEQRTLFVKNLNFDTSDASLKDFFAQVAPVVTATVARKRDMARPGEHLSMGYGFVELQSREQALECLKRLQGKELEDHALELKLSERVSAAPVTRSKRSAASAAEAEVPESTKLIVRNVPFEATRKELFDVFSPFGQLKSVRLPQKPGGQHRGFAFIEFLTKEEAKKAFESLKATHFYGRHLVLEWAAEDASVEQMREKTAARFKSMTNANKRIRLTDADLEKSVSDD